MEILGTVCSYYGIWHIRVQILLGNFFHAHAGIPLEAATLVNWDVATCRTLAQVGTTLVHIKDSIVTDLIEFAITASQVERHR